jgi:signal transduction histidine kinase
MAPAHPFDRMGTLRNLLQVLAFTLALAAVQVAFNPARPYGIVATFSICIGVVTWAVIDLGRYWFPSAAETGWPTGAAGLALVAAGIACGWFVGHTLAEQLCAGLGLFSPTAARVAPDTRSDLLITLLAGLVGTGWFYVQHRGAWLERRRAEAEQLAADARLKLLEAQLEPHMLFNTLANLRALIGLDPARAQQMLDHLDAFLRSTLAASRASTHPLQAEFDRLRDYLALMAVRMGPRLRLRLELPPALGALPVPTLVLQPLVENAIVHGLEPQVDGGELAVSARAEPGRLVLEVCDGGAGLDPTRIGNGGFGLQQVRERLATLYGDAAGLALAPVPGGGTCARLWLPLPEGRA